MTNLFSIGELTRVFKGKKFSQYDSYGNIAVVNIGDVNDNGIAFNQLKRINAPSINLERYQLKTGDVLVSSKGTMLKLAVFEEQNEPVIASANFTILRPKDQRITGFYIKFYLDSVEGRELLETANTGKSTINLNTKLIESIRIPIIPKMKQLYLEQTYAKGLNIYQQKIIRANQEWDKLKSEIRKNLF